MYKLYEPLFISLLRNSLNPVEPNLTSLQRPYTQHASESHFEFFACFLYLLSTLFPTPPSLRQYKQWKDQKVRRGAKSLYRVSIWPHFRRALHTQTHAEDRHAGEHAHNAFQAGYWILNILQLKTYDHSMKYDALLWIKLCSSM